MPNRLWYENLKKLVRFYCGDKIELYVQWSRQLNCSFVVKQQWLSHTKGPVL